MVSDDDDFQCYNNSEGKPVHTNLDDELPKDTNLTPETGIKTREPIDESHLTVRESKRIPHAKQTALGGIPYYTKNNKKKTSINCISQEKQTNQPDQPQTNSNEELDN